MLSSNSQWNNNQAADGVYPDISRDDVEQINILILGNPQSGKSSLIEAMKMYADPSYAPDLEPPGPNGSWNFTVKNLEVSSVVTDLHSIEIRKLRGGGDEYDVVDLKEQAQTLSKEAFENLLNFGSNSVNVVTLKTSKMFQFNIYEGPYLNGHYCFELGIFNIYKTLVQSEKKFHQVLFTVPSLEAPRDIYGCPVSIDDAFNISRVCSDIFSDLCPLFSFVHTKIDYSMLHVSNTDFQDSMRERKQLIQEYHPYTGTQYLIDCNLTSTCSPVQRAKTLSVIREILEAATHQEPMELQSPLMKQTLRMASIDSHLRWLTRDKLQDIQKEIKKIGDEKNDLRNKIDKIDRIGGGNSEESVSKQQQRAEYERQLAEAEDLIETKMVIERECTRLMDLVRRTVLPLDVVEALVRAEVYECKETPFDLIKDIYLRYDAV
ncbi:hypothetical protein CPB97_010489 [Podila verticillata]|nr:hypothetical protein CPB97_010489 [Podila verticillata]